MAIDVTSPRSRRALLGAVLGAGAATLAQPFGRPLPARAAEGDFVRVGFSYGASSTTQLTNSTTVATVLSAQSSMGGAGLIGESSSGNGVYGSSGSGNGVVGDSTSGTGVFGSSSGSTKAAIVGRHFAQTGIIGYSGIDGVPGGRPKTGVYGRAEQDADAVGARGQSGPGIGVVGQSTDQIGVHGLATADRGDPGLEQSRRPRLQHRRSGGPSDRPAAASACTATRPPGTPSGGAGGSGSTRASASPRSPAAPTRSSSPRAST